MTRPRISSDSLNIDREPSSESNPHDVDEDNDRQRRPIRSLSEGDRTIMSEKCRTGSSLCAQSVHGDGEEAGVDDGGEDEDPDADEHWDESENPGDTIDESGVLSLFRDNLEECEKREDVDGLLIVVSIRCDGELTKETADIVCEENLSRRKGSDFRENSPKNKL